MGVVAQKRHALRAWIKETFSAGLSPRQVGAAVAIGVFIGCLPVFGVHIFMCVAVARWLRLNQGVMYLAANISNPLFVVPLLAAEVAVGQRVLRGGVQTTGLPATASEWMGLLGNGGSILVDCLVGSLFVGSALGLVLGALAWAIAHVRARRPVGPVEDVTPAG
jgi:hypothetical protein